MDKIAVLIPCYNESRTIEKVVTDFKRVLPEATIYVYDNNSTDGTDELARGAGAEISALGSKLKQILHYLDEHYTETISLDFLAEEFYISKYYLAREFKKEYGTTIIRYVLAKKITHAKELLRYSNSSIEEIARLCGMDDASYFNKVFKKMEGCTASEYRKQW